MGNLIQGKNKGLLQIEWQRCCYELNGEGAATDEDGGGGVAGLRKGAKPVDSKD